MDKGENEHVEKLFRQMRDEHHRSRRELEKASGVVLIIASLVMAAIYLTALGYSANNLLVQGVSIISLIVAVGLFARGLQHALIGRR